MGTIVWSIQDGRHKKPSHVTFREKGRGEMSALVSSTMSLLDSMLTTRSKASQTSTSARDRYQTGTSTQLFLRSLPSTLRITTTTG